MIVAADGDDPNARVADNASVAFDQEASRCDLARMIVRHGYRFSMVDDVGFRTFVHNLQPQFKMVPYDAVRADCMKIYDDTKAKLHESLFKLPSRYAFSFSFKSTALTSFYTDWGENIRPFFSFFSFPDLLLNF
jgi:hypothetical protein